MKRKHNNKLLVISHDATRTGAPILLLNFLHWLRTNSAIPFEIFLGRGGALEKDFKSIGHVLTFYQELPRYGLKRLISPFLRKRHLRRLKKYFKKQNIGLIYANTIATSEMIDFLSFLSCPVICHVHELEYIIRAFGADNFTRLISHSNQFIAASEKVKNNLISSHNIEESKIEKIYSFVKASEIEPSRNKGQICRELNIPLDAPIVCMAGSFFGWRKASDIFVLLARDVNKRNCSPVHFLWIGGQKEGLQNFELTHDARKLNIDRFIHILGDKSDPFNYFAASDIFAMVSREDPFPLVCLEAAALGKPIVCFDKAGGTPEFVEDDAGFIVPYLDTEAMAEKIVELIKNSTLCHQMGTRAQEKVRAYYDIKIQAPKMLLAIERTMNDVE